MWVSHAGFSQEDPVHPLAPLGLYWGVLPPPHTFTWVCMTGFLKPPPHWDRSWGVRQKQPSCKATPCPQDLARWSLKIHLGLALCATSVFFGGGQRPHNLLNVDFACLFWAERAPFSRYLSLLFGPWVLNMFTDTHIHPVSSLCLGSSGGGV